jgi:secreted trypsin-like serine protease
MIFQGSSYNHVFPKKKEVPVRLPSLLILMISSLFISSCKNNVEPLSKNQMTLQNAPRNIIGGMNADTNEFPFLVNIWHNLPKQQYVSHHCGGSLIAPTWVLTAAHCLFVDGLREELRLIKPSEMILYIGSNKISGEGGQKLKVKSLIPHPKYSWPHYDVALIELAEPVTTVSPVELNDQDLDDQADGLKVTAAGWGLIDQAGETSPDFMQKIELNLISRKKCQQDPFPAQRSWTISSDILCAESSFSQKSICPGDSGGPLIQYYNGHYRQVGIVSWGLSCRGAYHPVQNSNADGYASVSDALPWIQGITGSGINLRR